MSNYLKERQIAINWLIAQGLPVLPVAPRQNPLEYPLTVYEEGRRFVRCEWIDSRLCPIPRFSGKNPSYLDADNVPHSVFHTPYQHDLPSSQDMRTWFHNPANGLMTMGGWQNIIWLDFDVKQFSNQEDCDRHINNWIADHSQMQSTFTERTHSGGWRFAVKVDSIPDFTNFTLVPGERRGGEALGNGRLTVLAPTIGPSGNAYQSIQRTAPIQVESLEEIGLHACSSRREKRPFNYQPRAYTCQSFNPDAIRLMDLISERVKRLLSWTQEHNSEDRSALLVAAARELYGCENTASEYGMPLTGDRADDLINEFGQSFGYDLGKIKRCLASVDPSSCRPSITFQGGETAFFEKVRKVNSDVYDQCCPMSIKQQLEQERLSRVRSIKLKSTSLLVKE